MNPYVYSGALIIAGIVLFALTIAQMNKADYSAQTENACSTLLQNQAQKGLKNGDHCAIWDGTQCRKGKYNNGQCESSGHVMYLISVLICISLIITGGVVAFKEYRTKGKAEETSAKSDTNFFYY